ncbi:MAG: AraC family transcriptional regulator [Heliobacteriaceae bacterium]|jgi:AraC-like DNA-binding protein|nr:AraC family transcriptional regulator [Heliobacteriaceae bacterium]
MNKNEKIELINFSCHASDYREGEHFNAFHSLGIVLSGIMELNDGQRKKQFKPGDLYSARKNHLMKFVKHPPENGDFKSLTIYFNEELLRDFSLEYKYEARTKQKSAAYICFQPNKALTSFMQSLLDYEEILNNKSDTKLILLKQKEALMLLLEYDITLKDVLFDFSEPHKVDLEAFMNKNFHFNVNLDKFACLTGRSLATFKRDFQKIFNTSPRNWLQQKRLEEALYLLTEKKQTASNIYLDLGFENLSHFSFAFKKKFGYAPTQLTDAYTFKSNINRN